ncbi:hypothetical protein E2C01_048080 [Portunus trituberculatus]|uniref:Uncharacterized protein n=1 Tax=Portunus trituberculatus TaxID=210409 RepID=A0A5B7G5F1_PORTR|nr:hypothetical protein [Portunus trituberculatus]
MSTQRCEVLSAEEACNQQVQRRSSVEDKSICKEWLNITSHSPDKETRDHVCEREKEEQKDKEVETNILTPPLITIPSEHHRKDEPQTWPPFTINTCRIMN